MVVGRERVGQEDGAIQRVRRVWIDGIGGEDKEDKNERIDPCMPEGEGFPSS